MDAPVDVAEMLPAPLAVTLGLEVLVGQCEIGGDLLVVGQVGLIGDRDVGTGPQAP